MSPTTARASSPESTSRIFVWKIRKGCFHHSAFDPPSCSTLLSSLSSSQLSASVSKPCLVASVVVGRALFPQQWRYLVDDLARAIARGRLPGPDLAQLGAE